ncbi:MAG: phosphoribosyltransferase family protein [Bacteroidia bacterium]|nr:phosphoribosyltransferase family protein [Bacteroidia bacterium]MDW8014624.1 phosphoribosyltransferase family protein [Bacteroidia bacterium]
MRRYALFLWEAQIVQVRTSPPWFRWSSGIESPIYVDHRRLLGHLFWRRWAVARLGARLRQASLSFRAIVGVATGGIPWAAWLGEKLSLPVGYVRPEPKAHGLHRQIEGLSSPTSVLLLEDLLSTGESLRRALFALEERHYMVVAAAVLWSYEFPSAWVPSIPFFPLLTFPQALLYWQEAQYLSSQTASFLLRWHRTLEPPLLVQD